MFGESKIHALNHPAPSASPIVLAGSPHKEGKAADLKDKRDSVIDIDLAKGQFD